MREKEIATGNKGGGRISRSAKETAGREMAERNVRKRGRQTAHLSRGSALKPREAEGAMIRVREQRRLREEGEEEEKEKQRFCSSSSSSSW